jgi:subtilisin-like proprotein convertase family protein
MSISRLVFSLACICVFSSAALAGKPKVERHDGKAWAVRDLPALNQELADAFEVEPNDDCPGNTYTLHATFHGLLEAGGDADWIRFSCDAGDEITLGTDVDDVLSGVDTVMELFADDCTTMLTMDDDSGPSLYSLIEGFPAPYTGNYHVRIRAFGSTQTGHYVAVGNWGPPIGPTFCPIDLYETATATAEMAIPDDDPAGVTCPPISFPSQPAFQISDIVVELDVEHTWVGDLVITLKHTRGTGEVVTAELVHQPGVPETSFGCSSDLVRDAGEKYAFASDPSLLPLGSTSCPATIQPACYAVASENPDGLTAFRGLKKGAGTWELEIRDLESGDTGTFYGWSMNILTRTSPVSVNASSWGRIKARYHGPQATGD